MKGENGFAETPCASLQWRRAPQASTKRRYARETANAPSALMRHPRNAALTPFLPQHRLAIDLEDGRQALAELPAIRAIMPRPVCAPQKRGHGLPSPRRSARDLEARHDEMDNLARGLARAMSAARRRRYLSTEDLHELGLIDP